MNQQKGENDHRNYFMINLHERMLPTHPQSPELAEARPTEPQRPVNDLRKYFMINLHERMLPTRQESNP